MLSSTADAFDRFKARRPEPEALQTPQMVQAGSRLHRWCRLAPGSPDGADWLQAPQMVQAGSNLPRWCRQVSPGIAGA